MAAKNGEEEKDGGTKSKGSGIMKYVIIVVLLAVLGGGGYAGWALFFHRDSNQASHSQPAPVEKTTCDVDTFLVNLADPGGKRYLKLTMKLVLSNPQALAEFTERSPELRDSILLLLSSKRFEDISTFAGKTSLKQETMAQLNRKMTKGQVEDVYFTEFLVQ